MGLEGGWMTTWRRSKITVWERLEVTAHSSSTRPRQCRWSVVLTQQNRDKILKHINIFICRRLSRVLEYYPPTRPSFTLYPLHPLASTNLSLSLLFSRLVLWDIFITVILFSLRVLYPIFPFLSAQQRAGMKQKSYFSYASVLSEMKTIS